MGMGNGDSRSIFSLFRDNPELTTEYIAQLRAAEAARVRAEGGTPLGETPVRTQSVYAQPTQTSDYANPIPQYTPTNFNMTPYAQAYQQQFNAMQPMQPPQLPQAPQQASGLGALAQLYGIHNAAPQDSASQDTHAASIAAAANTPI